MKRKTPARAPSKSRAVAVEAEDARLAVNVPIEVHRTIKARAAADGVSIRDFILALLARDGIKG